MAQNLDPGPDFIRQFTQAELQPLPESVMALLQGLNGPSWIHIPGRDATRKRLVVTLLHGNEPSGVRAVHGWLAGEREPAVDTVVYLGSVTAALAKTGFAYRSLPGERDANRCHGEFVDDRQGRIARDFTRLFTQHSFEALIDIHNNTGHNPAYGIGYGADPARMNLTTLFADWYMNSDLQMHTLVEMTQAHCPSISVECGRAGDPAADAAALAGLERFLHLPELHLDAPPPATLRTLQHPTRVHVRPDASMAFGDGPRSDADITLREDIDRHNFDELPPGVVLGWVRDGVSWPIAAYRSEHRDISTDLFQVERGLLKTRRTMIPVMMTTNSAVARSDCLFYAMEPG